MPLLCGLLLEASADGLTLSCFDYEISARITVPAEVFEPGSALVPGKLLAEITRSLPARPVEFAAEAEVVTLTCGRAEFGLVCLTAEDYPALPEPPAPVGVADGGPLAAAVLQVASSASRDDTLPMLTAICVDVDGEVLTLAATDRYRMAARNCASLRPSPMSVRPRWCPPGPWRRRPGDDRRGARDDRVRRGPSGRAGGAGRAAAPGRGDDQPGLGGRRLTARLIGGEFIRYAADSRRDFGGLPTAGGLHRGGPARRAGRRPWQPGAAGVPAGPRW